MFLLVGCGPCVSIYWLWAWRCAICLYWVAVYVYMCVCMYVYMCVCICVCMYVCMYVCVCVCVCVCGPYVFIGDCYESYHMFSLTMEPSTGHVIKYYKRILVIG